MTKIVTKLLEQQKVNKAISYFKFTSGTDRKKIADQLEKLTKDLQPIKAKAKRLLQTSYKNYNDSLNIDQVIYYND